MQAHSFDIGPSVFLEVCHRRTDPACVPAITNNEILRRAQTEFKMHTRNFCCTHRTECHQLCLGNDWVRVKQVNLAHKLPTCVRVHFGACRLQSICIHIYNPFKQEIEQLPVVSCAWESLSRPKMLHLSSEWVMRVAKTVAQYMPRFAAKKGNKMNTSTHD